MRTWTVTVGVALATMMLFGSALAQTPTGTLGAGTELYAMKSDATKSSATRGRRSPLPPGDEMVKAAQQALREKGHDPGSVDGRIGRKTQQALRDYQSANGLQPTGLLDLTTLVSLGVEPAKTSSADDSTAIGSASPATGDGVPSNAADGGGDPKK